MRKQSPGRTTPILRTTGCRSRPFISLVASASWDGFPPKTMPAPSPRAEASPGIIHMNEILLIFLEFQLVAHHGVHGCGRAAGKLQDRVSTQANRHSRAHHVTSY